LAFGIRMKWIPADTRVEAVRKQFEILRRLDAQTRVRMAFEASDYLRSIVEAGVRHRHPDYDEEKVQRDVVRLMVGDTLFRQMCRDIETDI
jgi:hypothetical protein